MPLKVPPVNATLTRIDGVEYVTDEYGSEIPQPVERWTGSASAYTTERHEAVAAEGGGTLLSYVATLSIPSSLAIAPGEYVTYLRHGVEQQRVVDAIEDRADAGFNRLFVKDVG